MRTIDKRAAIDLLRCAVRDYGTEHELPKGAPADYFNGPTPLCLVGVALSFVGVKRRMLEPSANSVRVDGVVFRRALARHGYSFTDGAIAVLRAAQSAQDDGAPWGEALQEAMSA